jgi:hypothetical protein
VFSAVPVKKVAKNKINKSFFIQVNFNDDRIFQIQNTTNYLPYCATSCGFLLADDK